jgi:hypothetical protein
MTVLNIHYAGGKCVRMASEHTLPKTAKVKKPSDLIYCKWG